MTNQIEIFLPTAKVAKFQQKRLIMATLYSPVRCFLWIELPGLNIEICVYLQIYKQVLVSSNLHLTNYKILKYLGYISPQTHLKYLEVLRVNHQSRSRLTKEVERKVYHLEWPWKAR